MRNDLVDGEPGFDVLIVSWSGLQILIRRVEPGVMALSDDNEREIDRHVVRMALDGFCVVFSFGFLHLFSFLLAQLLVRVSLLGLVLSKTWSSAWSAGMRVRRSWLPGRWWIEILMSKIHSELKLRKLASLHDIILGFTNTVPVEEHVLRERTAMSEGPTDEPLLHHVSQIHNVFSLASLKAHRTR